MHERKLRAVVLFGVLAGLSGQHPLHAQDAHDHMAMGDSTAPMASHGMWQTDLGRGWKATGSGQAFPVVTFGAPTTGSSPLSDTRFYLTQAAVMAGLHAPLQRFVLRATLNFEGLTQEDGELTYGAWGEGFIDKRHPHTLLHELMLSANLWDVGEGALSVSVGKGFAPFGTDDPMSRPGLKYPTNHHLSQILERWMAAGAYVGSGWSLEAGLFWGAEPEDPYDLGNIDGFADSWSTRATHRWSGAEASDMWEVSASFARVAEAGHGEGGPTRLWNAAFRHAADADSSGSYALAEASLADGPHGDEFFSVLAEGLLERSGHQPYARIEYASRPEYPRGSGDATLGFFRYEHGAVPIGSTRWLIGTAAYAYEVTGAPLSFRPFVELQGFHVWAGRGGVDPVALFGSDGFWSVSIGARIYLWGGPMRMGAYGVLDSMTTMSRGGL